MRIANNCDIGDFSISEESDCEHCRTLPPFTVLWSNGGTWYCLNCARYDDDFKITVGFYKKLLKIQKEKAKKFYTEALKNIENQTELF